MEDELVKLRKAEAHAQAYHDSNTSFMNKQQQEALGLQLQMQQELDSLMHLAIHEQEKMQADLVQANLLQKAAQKEIDELRSLIDRASRDTAQQQQRMQEKVQHALSQADQQKVLADSSSQQAAELEKHRRMLEDQIQSDAVKYQTQVLTNADVTRSRQLPESILVDGRHFEVMGSTGTVRWLGRKVRFHDPHDHELSNRIAAGWGAFTKHKEELTCRRFRLKDRLKLFTYLFVCLFRYVCNVM